jgi:hypothetical protein
VTKASDNAYPSILITEGTVPATPAAGKQRFYIDSTSHLPKLVNSSGAASNVGSGISPGQTSTYPSTFASDTINGSSTTPFVDTSAFDTKEVLNSRILHLQTLGASKDQRVRVTLGTTKAAAFDVSSCVAFAGAYWSTAFDTYLEIRLSTSADAQIAIARIGVVQVAPTSTGSNVNEHMQTVRLGGSSISAQAANIEYLSSLGMPLTVRMVRDGSNVITFGVGYGTAPMVLIPPIKLADNNPFTTTVSGTLARVEYSIHTPSGPGSGAAVNAYVDYLASV